MPTNNFVVVLAATAAMAAAPPPRNFDVNNVGVLLLHTLLWKTTIIEEVCEEGEHTDGRMRERQNKNFLTNTENFDNQHHFNLLSSL